MNNSQIGKLIRTLRGEKDMTQLEFATQLGVTDQAVSKWERGLGGPDISLLPQISRILGVNIEQILAGDLQSNKRDSGNMKKIKFFVCTDCGGILTATSEAEPSCCGRKLERLQPQAADLEHQLNVAHVEDDFYITSPHPMTRAHYLSFAACVRLDRVLLIKLYPEQDAAIRFPRMSESTLFYYCTQHGLMAQKLE